MPRALTWAVVPLLLVTTLLGSGCVPTSPGHDGAHSLPAGVGSAASPTGGPPASLGSGTAPSPRLPSSGVPRFPVEFAESGLPFGATWGVSVAGQNVSSSGNNLTVFLANGSYPYTIRPPAGSNVEAEAGTVQVAGVPEKTLRTVPWNTGSWGVLADPYNDRLYVTNSSNDTMLVLNASTLAVVGSVATGLYPFAPLLGTGGQFVYVVSNGDGKVTVVNASTDAVAVTLLAGSAAQPGAIDPATGLLYVPNIGSNNVTVFDSRDHTYVRSINTDMGPWAVIPIPGQNEIYVATQFGSTQNGILDIVNLTTGTTAKTVSLPTRAPYGGVYVPGTDEVLIAETVESAFLIVNTSTEALAGTVPIGHNQGPHYPVYDPSNGMVYFTSQSNGNLSILDPQTNELVGSIGLSGSAYTASYDAADRSIWVAPFAGHELDEVDGAPQQVSGVFPLQYGVDFTESGLAAGTPWTVTLGNTTTTSSRPTVAIDAANGTYPFVVHPVAGYLSSLDGGNLTVTGAPQVVLLVFTPPAYAAWFNETGLPPGTSWSVNADGTSHTSSTRSIDFLLANGSYGYSIPNVDGYVASPSGGPFAVEGSPVNEAVQFTLLHRPYPITLTETGLPAGSDWSATVNGTTNRSSTGSLGFADANGSYAYTIVPPPGYQASPASGTVLVQGAPVSVSIGFAVLPPATYQITFEESGLPNGSIWSVDLNGQTGSPAALTPWEISFTRANGTYSFSANTTGAFVPTNLTGSVTVRGSNVTQAVVFVPVPNPGGPNPPGPTFDLLGLGPTLSGLLVAIAAVVVASAALLLWRRRRSPPPPAPAAGTDEPAPDDAGPYGS